ncbi:terminase [Pseudomonas fluvialis]|uniref:Terminase n=1 Tax=Pseudomonas fluvialis TaxID=1793966 RepID=A0A2I0CTQ6_9PSED|nr:terminase [Pseudomonas pharmacofabricae]
MSRPRTPTNVLDARGAFKKDPQRARTDAQTAGPLGKAPSHITGEVLKAWKEIEKSAPLQVLTESDRLALELAANLLAQFRLDPVEFPAAKLVRLEALLGKFGMTPADRAKVGGKKEAPKGNAFADL